LAFVFGFQMGERTAVNAGNSLGWHDLHARLCPAVSHQASARRLRLSGGHCDRADRKLTWEALASGSQYAGGTTAQPTRLWQLCLQTHSW